MYKIAITTGELLDSLNTLVEKINRLVKTRLINNIYSKKKQFFRQLILFFLFFVFTLVSVDAQPLKAFPTANGAGAYVTGGRGKPVYIVTNLNNSGVGSFRNALEKTRTTDGGIITFAVSGTIVLTSRLEFANQDNITIAGQTAPAGGITIVAANSQAKLELHLVNNFIIRYVRFRPSYPAYPSTEIDAINIYDCSNYIIDHCSLSWGTDENADSGDGNNFTWQRNLFAESNKTGMIMGEEVDNSKDMSFINNMFYNCNKRFPNVQSNGRVDVINNVVWNFRTLISINQGGHDLNHIGNYYQYFRSSPAADPGRWNLWYPFDQNTGAPILNDYPSIYTSGNYISDVLTDPNADNYFTWRWRFNPVGSPYSGAAANSPLTTDFKANSQFPLLGSPFTIQSASDAFENVRHNVGTNARLDQNGNSIEELDAPDALFLNNVQNDILVDYTPETNLSTAHYSAFQGTVSNTPIEKHAPNFDTNNDGIPNQWVINKGFGFNEDLTNYVWPSGYVGIEEYLNEVDNSASANSNAGCSVEITSYPYFEGFENTFGNWTQSTTDDIDWTINIDGTPTNGTGPSSASQGAYYAYVEASGSGTGFPTKQALLNSPCFNLSGLLEANFSFKYHQYGSNDMGSIALEASNDEGATWISIWNSTGNKGDNWLSANVDLGAFIGGNLKLRFNRVTGSTFQTDVAIDEINLSVVDAVVIVDDCSTEITSYPYLQGFENTLGNWTQSTTDDIDWIVNTNGTPSNGTGPSSASQGSYYAYVEASGSGTGFPTKQAILNSPCFNLSGLSEANFSFKYHQYGSNDMGSIDLEVSTDDGGNWTSIWNSTGNKGDNWLTANVDLGTYVGEILKLRFNRITGGTFQTDVAIDEVSLSVVNTVIDTEAPVITLTGSSTINLNIGDTYSELGATAVDNVDGDISTSITIGGDTVNTSSTGTYNITYNISDIAGNAAIQVIRTVNVLGSTAACTGEITSYPYLQGFENTLGNWTQSTTDDIDWTVNTNGTPSNGTGPSSASQGSYYAYVEASGSGTGFPTKQAILYSPCFNLSGLSDANFSFKYHQYGSNDMGSLALEVSTNDGGNWTSIWNSTGNKGDNWLTANVDLGTYVGEILKLRFNRITGGTFQTDVAIDEVSLSVVNTVIDTEAPVITLTGSSTINLNIGDTYSELGATAVDNVDGDISTSITIGGDTVNTSSIGTYYITYDVSDTSGNEAVQVLRTIIVNSDAGCSNTISSFPYFEGFESTLGAWTQASTDDMDWSVNAGGTPSNGTGPSSASQGKYYVYVEASNHLNKQAILNSPCFDLSDLSQANFSFNYHQYGSDDMGKVTLEASNDDGVSWITLWNTSGNLGDSWQIASIDLSSYAGGNVQLRFNRITGSTWQADFAIDEVNLTEGNNSANNGCSDGITSYPYSQSFENTLGDWTQSTTDDIDWTVNSNGTPSNGTGPSSASQGLYYIYVEASGSGVGFPTKQAVLNSPCFNLSALNIARFSFDYHQFGSQNMGTIDLEASDDNGNSWISLWTSSGNLGDSWQSANVNLSAYIGGSVQLRFNRITGNTWDTDIAIDNINISTAMARMQTMAKNSDNDKEITLHPNPVKGNVLNIKTSNSYVTYEIYNMVGQLVSKGNLEHNSIDVSNLSPAIYQIIFSSEGEIIPKQFIRQ